MVFQLVLLGLPVFFLFVYSQKPFCKYCLASTSKTLILLFLAIMILCIAYYPEALSTDKYRYSNMYKECLILGWSLEYKDIGWIVYTILCGWLFGNNINLFYLITAFVYVGAFYIVGKRYFAKDGIGYYIVLTTGCLSFINYGTNVIRSGMALSLLLIAASLSCKSIWRVLLAFVAFSFHKATIIPILAFFGAKYIKKTWIAVFFWGVCLILSIANFDMGSVFEEIGFVDARVEQYGKTINGGGGGYKAGFRWDFLIYSLVPILIAFYYISKKRATDVFYSQIVRMYLYANAVWLLVIRINFSDRLAYLSWFLIPFITLYPVVNYQLKFRYPQIVVIMVMSIFMGVGSALVLRDLL